MFKPKIYYWGFQDINVKINGADKRVVNIWGPCSEYNPLDIKNNNGHIIPIPTKDWQTARIVIMWIRELLNN